MTLVAGAAGNSLFAGVHGERVSPLQRIGLLLRDHAREQAVPGTFPDAGIAVDGAHPVPIAWVRASNFAEWIRSARLLRLHACLAHPFIASPELLVGKYATGALAPVLAYFAIFA
ncbi:MAG: hypothetical protein ACJ789_01030 [Thermomicrobiales bacterium]